MVFGFYLYDIVLYTAGEICRAILHAVIICLIHNLCTSYHSVDHISFLNNTRHEAADESSSFSRSRHRVRHNL